MDGSEITIRKLAWASLGFAAGICAARFLMVTSQFIFFAALAVICAAVLRYARGLWRLRVFIFAVALAFGVLWSTLYSAVFVEKLFELDGKVLSITAVAEDTPKNSGKYSRVNIRVSGEDMPSFRAVLYDFDNALATINPGDELTGKFSFRRADKMHGEDYTGYMGSGVFLLAYPESQLTLTGKENPIYFPRRLNNYIGNMVSDLFPEDVSAFQKALLTGDTTEYYVDRELSRTMSHAGLAHVVSVSGMHVSFIAGLILLFSGKRRAFIFGVPVVLLFMLMAGMTPPIVRAGVMFLALLAAPMLRRENDPITILGFVMAAILLQNPMAIYSISLQLSFATMLGILVLSGRILEFLVARAGNLMKIKLVRPVLLGTFGVMAMSLGAMAISIPLVALHFGYVSIYSPITNLLTYVAVSVVFCLGYPVCALGAVFPADGERLADFLAVVDRYIFWVAELIGKLPGNVLYIENPFYVQWLGLSALLFAGAWILRGSRTFQPLFPSVLSAISLCFAMVVTSMSSDNTPGEITALDVGQGQSIVMLSKNQTVVIDCGGKGTFDDPGEVAAEYLISRGRSDIDALVLTHLHEDHVNGVVSLMELVAVEKLVMAPGIDDSDEMLSEILEEAQQHNTEVSYIQNDIHLNFGDIMLTIFAPLGSEKENERGLIIRGSIGEFDALITGDVNAATERELIEEKPIGKTELLIIGHHGSKYSTSLELMEKLRPYYSVISVGYNSYGHPTTEAIERATAFDGQLYRTDLNGNITFYMGEDDG